MKRKKKRKRNTKRCRCIVRDEMRERAKASFGTSILTLIRISFTSQT